MDSQAIALLIAGGGLVLGVARLAISILSYRLDSRRVNDASKDSDAHSDGPAISVDR